MAEEMKMGQQTESDRQEAQGQFAIHMALPCDVVAALDDRRMGDRIPSRRETFLRLAQAYVAGRIDISKAS